MGGAVFPPRYLTWSQTMVEEVKTMATSFRRPGACTVHSAPLTLQQGITDPHLRRRLLDTHWQVWASLSWGHCSFLLGPGVHKVLFVPSKSLFSQSCISFWWLYGGVNGNLLQEGLYHTQVYCTQSPSPCGRPLLTHTPSEDTQTLKGRFGSVSVGCPGAHKGLFEPSKHLWQVQGLILNMISCPPSPNRLAGTSRLPLDMGYLFWWDPTFSINGYSASCNFGVLAGEDECTPSILPSYKQPTV